MTTELRRSTPDEIAFAAESDRAELEAWFLEGDAGNAADGSEEDALSHGCGTHVLFAIDRLVDDGAIAKGDEFEALFQVAKAKAIRAARESIAATVSAWLAAKEDFG